MENWGRIMEKSGKDNFISRALIKKNLLFVFLIFLFALISCSGTSTITPDISTTTSLNPNPTTTISEPGLSEYEIFNLFGHSVFKLHIFDNNDFEFKQGTGFILKSDGTFVTNAHLIRDAWTAQAFFDGIPDGFNVSAIYYYDAEQDWAIGKIDLPANFTVQPVEFTTDYADGDRVFSIGYPKYANQRIVTSGHILDISYNSQVTNKLYIRTDSYLDHGSSGGILANAYGKVIGLTTVSFLDNTFGSILATDFSYWQNKTPDTVSTLENYFHPSRTVRLSVDNFEDYFRIDTSKSEVIDNAAEHTFAVDYVIQVAAKSQIEVPEQYNNIYATIILDVTYTYNIDNVNHTFTDSEQFELNISLSKYILSETYKNNLKILYAPERNISNFVISYQVTYVSGTIIYYE